MEREVMISSKGIKILCYIIMALAFVASFVLLIMGVLWAIDGSKASIAVLIIAVVFPLGVTVSLYPIFALANVDENLASLNGTVEELVHKISLKIPENGAPSSEIGSNSSAVIPAQDKPANSAYKQYNPAKTYTEKETVEYVNAKYGLNISLDDSCETIKEKVAAMNATGFYIIVLQRKVAEAQTKEEIINYFAMHHVAYG